MYIDYEKAFDYMDRYRQPGIYIVTPEDSWSSHHVRECQAESTMTNNYIK